MSDVVQKGSIDWTGDNPFIYLKEDPAGPWNCLALFFRVAVSDFGAGRAILVLEAPEDAERAGACRVCVTDNSRLAVYLITNFAKKYGLFRPYGQLLDRIDIIEGCEFRTEVDGMIRHAETATSAKHALTVSLVWEGLGQPFAVLVPPEKTQTGAHSMFCVFQPVAGARVVVRGRDIPGSTVPRDFYHGTAQSAALAHSETWIRADNAHAGR